MKPAIASPVLSSYISNTAEKRVYMGSSEQIFSHQLRNGITLIGEPIEGASSAAFAALIPAGAAHDPDGFEGSAAMLVEMLNKGAGPWNSRQLSEQFDEIGVHRSQSPGVEVSLFSGAGLGEHIGRMLDLVSIILQQPHLPADELESVRMLTLQELDSLEDEPSSKVMVELARVFYPHPFGRCQLGTKAGLQTVNIESLWGFYRRAYRPDHAIIGVAGRFDWQTLVDDIEKSFGGWTGSSPLLQAKELSPLSSNTHIEKDTNQLQIAIACPSVSLEHPDYYTARVAVGVLSGGMCGRLFVEVREKLGLVYRVSASHSAAKGRAAVFTYAGTTPENGQQTLEVIIRELRKLSAGVTDEELARAKTDLKSRLIMQAELSSVRASGLVNDWWNLGRARTISEIKTGIEQVTSAAIVEHINRHPIAPLTLVTLGPEKLELPQ